MLANFGIYIGRELRFQQRDASATATVLSVPVDLFDGVPRRGLAYTLAFSAFTACVYLVVALPLLS